ncbi:MAG: hypothetical protein B1H05_00115 [Candidatus Cloacimonas sp. 4484_140]|nr:MAG: hypothetical protein B1H05_00115 [Candidatus Cloacimonas sp. 4484_140]
MIGYYISSKQVRELGLLDNPKIAEHLKNTIIAITTDDLLEENQSVEFNETKIEEMMIWFYKNYYESLKATFVSFLE